MLANVIKFYFLRIALNLREQGRGPSEPGRLKCCQAIGWYLQEHNIAQISVNLTDFDVTPIHIAYEEVSTLLINNC